MAHICFVTGLYSRYDSLIYYRQGRGLIASGHKVSIVVCDLLPDECIEGIHIYSTHYVPKNRIERFLGSSKAVQEIADKIDADIYQLQDPEPIGLVRHFRNKGKKVFFNMREYYPDMILHKEYLPTFLRRYVSWYYERLISKYFSQYDSVFTVTPEFVEILEKKFKLNNICLLTNYPIPNPEYRLEKVDYMSRHDVIIYEGTIYENSRQDVFMDALSKIPQVQYLMVGKIDENNSIMQHPYWSKVEFVNGFKQSDLKGFFQRSTISNTLRDFGGWDGSLGVIKIFESMEAALPVVFSDVPMYRKIVEQYKCGVCADPNDAKSIESAIRYLVENKEEAYWMGQNGRKAVLEEFNWWKQMEKYENSIKKCLNNDN